MDCQVSIHGRRLILWAEVLQNTQREIGNTVEISPAAAFVQTPLQMECGSQVCLRLSFPRLVPAFELAARVTHFNRPQGPGEPIGLGVEFLFDRPGERLPLDALLCDPAASSPVPVPQAGGGSYRVLLVEDSAVIREVFAFGARKLFTERRNLRVDFAADGPQAWDLLLQGTIYDLVVIDYHLPTMAGSQLVRRIRADERLHSVPVVAISVGDREPRAASLAAGADLFLDKPVVVYDLFRTIDHLTTRTVVASCAPAEPGENAAGAR